MKMKKLIRFCSSVAIAAAVAAVPIGSSVAMAADNNWSILDDTVLVKTETITDSGYCGTGDTSSSSYEYVKWVLENNVLTISGTGLMRDYDYENDYYTHVAREWEDYLDSIKKITIQSGVTSVGNVAFYDMGNVSSVSIPSSVTSIGYWGFGYCTSLSSITIPSSVLTIGSYAFYNCTALDSITFKGDAPIFGDEVFEGTASTLKIYYPLTNSTWTTAVLLADNGGTPTYIGYKGSQSITIKKSTFKKTLSAKKLKKKKSTFKVKATAKGKVTYSKVSGDSHIKINKNGKVTVKKGTPKGTYKVKVLVTAKSTSKYNKNTKTTTLTVKVKK